MKNVNKVLSFQITEEEMLALDSEAQNAPFYGNRSDMCRSVMSGRHDKNIVASPQAQQLIDHHTQKIEEIEAEHQQQIESLDQKMVRQYHQISHFKEQYEEVLDRLIITSNQHHEDFDKLAAQLEMKEFLLQHEKGQHQTVCLQLTETEKQLQQANAKIKELEKEINQGKSFNNILDTVSKGINHISSMNPGLGDVVSEHGWNGLFFGNSTKSSVPTDAARLGQAIQHDFPGEKLSPALDILQFLRDNPSEQEKLMANPAFLDHIQLLRKRQQTANRDKVPS